MKKKSPAFSYQAAIKSFTLKRIIVSVLILIIFMVTHFVFANGFLFVLIVMGTAAVLLKFFDGEKGYFFLGLYARIVLIACFMSLALFFSINKIYIHISKQAGNKIATEILAFEQENDRYHETLDEIEDDLHFNFLESLFYRRINYQSLEKSFELTSTSLLYQEKLIYDVEFMCWM